MIEWCTTYPGYTFLLVLFFAKWMFELVRKCLDSFDRAIEEDRRRMLASGEESSKDVSEARR